MSIGMQLFSEVVTPVCVYVCLSLSDCFLGIYGTAWGFSSNSWESSGSFLGRKHESLCDEAVGLHT